MKRTINFSDFCDAFFNMGRKDQFSYNGKKALFEHIESIEQDTGSDIELDIVSLCCDFSEYSNALYAALSYSAFNYENMNEEEQEREALQFLSDNTTVIHFENGIIIQNF
jgi:hypothetical protein